MAADLINGMYDDGDAGQKALLVDRYNRFEEGKKIAQDGQRVLANIAPGLGPALDAAEAVSGKDLLTENCVKLSWWERGKRFAYAAGPYAFVGVLGIFAKVRKARAAAAAGKAADDVADACPSARAAIATEVAAVEPRGGVYLLRNAEDGQVMRTGRTKDLLRRKGDHFRDPALKDYIFEPVYRTDVYAEQRGLEQELDWLYNPPLNYDRPIDPHNPNLLWYLQAANDYLDKLQGILH